MDITTITEIFQRLATHTPAPTTALLYRTPFELLIAVLLSAQATDISVNKVTPALFAVANTPSTLLALGETRLKDYIKSIGLYPTKARHIIALCQQLITLHNGQVPSERAALEALPGVGRKTANVVLNVVFGEETIAVDTHVFRVSNRTGLAPGKTPLAVETALLKVVPAPYRNAAHHWLILHGRHTCKAQRPLCGQCVIADLCTYPHKTAGASDVY